MGTEMILGSNNGYVKALKQILNQRDSTDPDHVIVYKLNNGPNGHLFYVGGDLMMRRGMLPIIMLPDGDLRIVLHLVPFWILTIWGSVHIEETVVGWRNQLRMKTSAT